MRFGIGRYPKLRAQDRLARGDETLWKGQWFDSGKRGRLVERLRRALRNRAKQVHPDTKVDEAAPTSGSGGHSRPDGELTIYDLNEAYEAVKKVLF